MKKRFDTYSVEELEILKEGGKILHDILQDSKKLFVVGKTTGEIDKEVEKMIAERGAEPAFKNYTPHGAGYPYPNVSCISINEEVTHGVPGDRIVQDGDLVSLDVGIRHKGLVLDAAVSFGVGNISEKEKKLLEVGERALSVALDQVRSNIYTNDIGKATEKYVRSQGMRVVYELCGHGVGRKVHSDPYIPHIDLGRKGDQLYEGMVIAVEPHITYGSGKIYLKKGNDYTLYAGDGAKAVQFEHTVYIDKDGPIILT
jgi:methionyl aminopeptidase